MLELPDRGGSGGRNVTGMIVPQFGHWTWCPTISTRWPQLGHSTFMLFDPPFCETLKRRAGDGDAPPIVSCPFPDGGARAGMEEDFQPTANRDARAGVNR
jgi:hypothetical protein